MPTTKAPSRVWSSLGRRVAFALLFAVSISISGRLPAQTAPQTAPQLSPGVVTESSHRGRAAENSTVEVVEQLAALAGPVGIDPLLAVAMFGMAGWLGLWTPPPGMTSLATMWVWASLAILAFLIKLGRSTKLTKPFAEAVGALESTGGLIVVIVVLDMLTKPTTSAMEANLIVDGGIAIIIAVSTVGSVMVLRTALDILIWLSPIPFVDFLFQVAKALITIGLVALAILFPTAAMVVNVLLFLTTALTFRWATRVAGWGLAIVWDLTVGRFSRPSTLPRDSVAAEDIGPLSGFVVEAASLPRRSACRLELRAGRWFLVKHRALRKPLEMPLGDANRGTLTMGWTGTVIALPAGSVLLPPRYTPLMATLARETRASLTDNRPVAGLRAVLNLNAAPGQEGSP
ncbi:MAG: hypothetical protein IPK13_08175 [Deltaproteobacteria bacterium]|nr:hypothetical protein [Deltaproteobacteria bacterium]